MTATQNRGPSAAFFFFFRSAIVVHDTTKNGCMQGCFFAV
jgi:hypothetical protein